MTRNIQKTPLGFIDESVPQGTHICLIYTNEEERLDALLKYLLSGLEAGERSICFSNELNEETLRAFFKKNNVSYDESKKNNAIALSGVQEVYFEDGVFDPQRMLKNLEKFYDEAMEMNFKGARVIGEMVSEVEKVPGGERLLEYESRVSILLRDHPVTAICQYNAHDFDGATIMNILKVHPQMIVNGAVIQNPLYIHPEEYLSKVEDHG